MKAQEINHAGGLAESLLKKAVLLEQQADDLDSAKDGNSEFAVRLRVQALDCRAKSADLKQAIAVALFMGS